MREREGVVMLEKARLCVCGGGGGDMGRKDRGRTNG